MYRYQTLCPWKRKTFVYLCLLLASAFPVDVKASDLLLWMTQNEDYAKNYQVQSGHNTDFTGGEVLQPHRSISRDFAFPYEHLSTNGISNELYQKRAVSVNSYRSQCEAQHPGGSPGYSVCLGQCSKG